MGKITKKTLTDDAILLRIRKYCALRERSEKEVRNKLLEIGVAEEHILSILERLVKEGFLNERRYVSAFAGGKFRTKKWGKRKIEIALKKQGISDDLLEKGLNEITTEDYLNTLDDLLKKKWKQIKSITNYELRITNTEPDFFSPEMQKLINYALQKGYEFEVIVERIKSISLPSSPPAPPL